MFSQAYRAVFAALNGVVQGFQAHRRFQRNYRELIALDDRQLQDIGISRSMIRSVAVTGIHHTGEVAWDRNLVINGNVPERVA